MKRSKKRRSSSRDDRIKKRKERIEISEKSSSQRKRALRKKKHKRQVFIRRRIILLIILLALIFLANKVIAKKFNKYSNNTYPSFRDEVRESIGDEVFVGDTSQRSLTTAEKKADLEILYNTISRNYAVSVDNKNNFDKFITSYDSVRKKVKKTKTDQEYFDLLSSYLRTLDNGRTKILEKNEYESLLGFYKNDNKTKISKLIQNPQAVDRYKRMVVDKKLQEKNTFEVANNTLYITMKDFTLSTVNSDYEKLRSIYTGSAPFSNIVIDLSDNSSVNSLYWQKLAPIFLHKDYQSSEIIFYRGNLIKNTLKEIKNDKEIYNTGFVQNPASKYPKEINQIKLNDYMYYDEVTSFIKKDTNFPAKYIQIITNDNSKNQAIKFANVLKENTGAKIIKNSSQSSNSFNDLINNFPADLFILDHSGLIVSVDDSFSINPDEKFLEYDDYVDSNNQTNTDENGKEINNENQNNEQNQENQNSGGKTLENQNGQTNINENQKADAPLNNNEVDNQTNENDKQNGNE